MTDRGLPSADGSPACPFVAFEDDRDARADRPDHRHRCFAEAQPAPRALAHQEAYCLSSAFPVCPTFQDWARREAAAAIPGAAEAEPAATEAAVAAAAAGDIADDDDDPWAQPRPEPPIEERPRRNPPRDWAAPPPWASSGSAATAGVAGAAGAGGHPGTPSYLGSAEEGQGLVGSPADRLARGEDIEADWSARPPARSHPSPTDSAAAPADPDLAGLVGRAAREAEVAESHVDVRPPAKAGRRPTVSSTRDKNRERERAAAAAAAVDQHEGPSWEKARRYEAYPSIKTRANLSGISGVPTIAILFGGVVLAAIVLFFLPGVLGVGGRDGGSGGGAGASASPSSAVEETASPSPTPIPKPTPQLYTIKTGDTLSKIARRFNVSLDALLAANKETIKNPNRIQVGDEIIIPLPETEQVPAEASPSG